MCCCSEGGGSKRGRAGRQLIGGGDLVGRTPGLSPRLAAANLARSFRELIARSLGCRQTVDSESTCCSAQASRAELAGQTCPSFDDAERAHLIAARGIESEGRSEPRGIQEPPGGQPSRV